MNITNYTVGVQGPPVCIGHEAHCLKIMSQAWLVIIKNTTKEGGPRMFYLLHAYGFEGNKTNSTFPPDLPHCMQSVVNSFVDWVHWTNCIGNEM